MKRSMLNPGNVLTPEHVDEALRRIPPLWPLKHFVAVNPFVGMLDQPFPDACLRMQGATGRMPLLTAAEYRDCWVRGVITENDLNAVADDSWPTTRLLEFLASDGPPPAQPIPTYADFLDARSRVSHWSALVVEEISKWCAATYDENQTTWKSPWSEAGLYAGWKAAAQLDRNPEAWGLRGFRTFVGALPEDAAQCIRLCMERLAPSVPPADFLHRQLATVSGWAGYLQYRVREDAMRDRPNESLKELLAIRIAFDAALHSAFGSGAGLAEAWVSQGAPAADADWAEGLTRWQRAYETGYQRTLATLLRLPEAPPREHRPTVQAIFCIDVRSEVFRRHLEAVLPDVQTIGFAGFFGFPVAHELATGETASRCPVLLVPPVTSCELLTEPERDAARSARARADAWRAIQNSAASCFSFVETVGLGFLATLERPVAPTGPACGPARPAPHLRGTTASRARASMAEGALRNMGLTGNFARLVLVCGHGSQSANNPFASGLDCGACGGHAGDVNARLAVEALNDPCVREHLASQGIRIPDDTVFVAGIHNTTTDEVALLDADLIPESHASDLAGLRRGLSLAGRAARSERAPRLAIDAEPESDALQPFRRRAGNISELRPEWGLANNAAFIAARRTRTAGHDLEGRAFLHDYDESADPDGRVLTLILSAPVVVASWINLQYYGSRVNPDLFGSGNKMLHNVVGGIGVFEGNGGDLRSGLPLQSLHDGERFVHEPRRLSVFVEAGTERIDAILRGNPGVRALFDNGWIHLLAFSDSQCHRYTKEGWRVLE